MEDSPSEQGMNSPRDDSKPSKTNIRSIPVFNVLITLLLIINLSFTALLATSHFAFDSHTPQSEDILQLPAELQSEQAKADLIDSFLQPYNSRDYEALWSLLDDIVKVELTYEDLVDTVDTIFDVGGQIEDIAYSYYSGQQLTDGRKYFDLYYKARTADYTATVKISILQQYDEPYRFIGFNVNFQ
jgi:hypothetical protein